MIGVVVATHGSLASALVTEALRAVEDGSQVQAVEVPTALTPEALLRRFRDAVASVDAGDGVLVLVDVLGGTPCNLGMALGPTCCVELVTGANLPMVMRALGRRRELALEPLAREVAATGVRSIAVPLKDRR